MYLLYLFIKNISIMKAYSYLCKMDAYKSSNENETEV